jgi:hypothetical protein
MFATSRARWISNKAHHVRFKTALTEISKDKLLMAAILDENDHLRWPGHLLPSPGDDFPWLKISLMGRKFGHTCLAILFPEELKPVEGSPLI